MIQHGPCRATEGAGLREDGVCARTAMNAMDLCTTRVHHEETSRNAVRSRSADTGRSKRPVLHPISNECN